MLAGMSRSKEAGSYAATVSIDDQALHPLPVTQYGHFIEHLGKCIKGGVWAEGESDDMFMGGVRRELLSAIRSINPALIRYPGGCFADGYHWKDGIGPRDKRPTRWNRAWGRLGLQVGPLEDNHFGTDEFLRLCEAVGAQPMITVNVGSGTAAEAAQWVEYVNGDRDTRWGSERAKNGHPEPHKVKYWFVGNEIFGWHEIGHMSPPEYVKTFRQYAASMRRVDPDIKLIAVGSHFPVSSGLNPNRVVLEAAGEVADYLSVHQYVPGLSLKNALRFQLLDMENSPSRELYYEVLASQAVMEQHLEACARDARAYSPGRTVPIAFDEWNLWFDFYQDAIHANYCLRDGLWTATMLNMLHRKAPAAPVANIAQMVNCLGIISSTEKGTFLTPSALAFRLYTEKAGEELMGCEVQTPPAPHESGVPALDVSATRAGDKLSIFMVNRHYDARARVAIRLPRPTKGLSLERTVMHHPDPVKYNTVRAPQAVGLKRAFGPAPLDEPGEGREVEIELEPHSLSCIEIAPRPSL